MRPEFAHILSDSGEAPFSHITDHKGRRFSSAAQHFAKNPFFILQQRRPGGSFTGTCCSVRQCADYMLFVTLDKRHPPVSSALMIERHRFDTITVSQISRTKAIMTGPLYSKHWPGIDQIGIGDILLPVRENTVDRPGQKQGDHGSRTCVIGRGKTHKGLLRNFYIPYSLPRRRQTAISARLKRSFCLGRLCRLYCLFRRRIDDRQNLLRIHVLFRPDRILQRKNPGVIADPVALPAIIVKKCRQNHIHAGSVCNTMIKIQMDPVSAKTHRPDMIVGLLRVQTDLFICTQEDYRKRILLVVKFVLVPSHPDLIIRIPLLRPFKRMGQSLPVHLFRHPHTQPDRKVCFLTKFPI